MDERRKYPRVAADAPASIVIGSGEPVRGTIANISEKGAFLRGAITARLHRPVHLQFVLRPDHTVCTASGTVAWQAPHGIGLMFDEVNDAFRDYLRELVAASQSVNPAPRREVLSRMLGEPDIAIE